MQFVGIIVVAVAFWLLGFFKGHVIGWNAGCDLFKRAIDHAYPNGEEREHFFDNLRSTCRRDDQAFDRTLDRYKTSIGL